VRVHSALPDPLTEAVDAVLRDIGHVAHAEDWTLEPERAL
jgi:hypothetical protein